MDSLPWFKWSPSEWLSGDIQYCSDASQLLFVKLCCIYWKNNCQLSVKVMRKRCQMRAEKLQKCVKELQADGMVSIKDDNISIKFLDEQYAQRVARSEVNAKNGKLGGEANAKQTVSERLDFAKHIDKEKEIEQEIDKDEAHPDFGLYKDTGRPKYDPMSDTGLRVAFMPYIEYRVTQMGDILAGLRWIIERSDYDQTLAAAEQLSGTGKIWIDAFIKSFKESQG